MPEGLLLINKPLDWTSFDVVAKARNILDVRKIGHTGTLDPKATGVLVLAVGKATKLIEFLVKQDKEYEAEITLGATSITDDSEGPITEVENAKEPSKEDIEEALKQFVGTFEQLPPDFSAKKVGGKRAHKAARAGKPLELKPQEVTMHSINILGYSYPKLTLRLEVGSGFYVRSLARDLGKALETGGYLSGLIRTRVGDFLLTDCVKIENVEPQKILPLSSIVGQLPAVARQKIGL